MRRAQLIGAAAALSCVAALAVSQLPQRAAGWAGGGASQTCSVVIEGTPGRTTLAGGGSLTQVRTASGIVIATVRGKDGSSTTSGVAAGDTMEITTGPEGVGGTRLEVSVTSTGDPERVSAIGRSPVVSGMAGGLSYDEAVKQSADLRAPGEDVPTRAEAEEALRPVAAPEPAGKPSAAARQSGTC
ncbi:hypothetical protein [Barrientosiimonas endolithica]|uniref:DUF5666 domain-containing protein n=1 Tax=Barrientosiimonas endolithica TaxID=1535208 RepID=A0ABN6YKD7_9MICO|nr:hypothetical protein [Barrientosiimonas endolithica]BDZ56495.1 hypothetical protein GCM10025872_01520 [Barrientosiimonas endolithica]